MRVSGCLGESLRRLEPLQWTCVCRSLTQRSRTSPSNPRALPARLLSARPACRRLQSTGSVPGAGSATRGWEWGEPTRWVPETTLGQPRSLPSPAGPSSQVWRHQTTVGSISLMFPTIAKDIFRFFFHQQVTSVTIFVVCNRQQNATAPGNPFLL